MKVLIDISNIIPGKGGAGGGVAVYAENLLEAIDNLIPNSGDTFICFKNKNNNNNIYKNIKVIETSYNIANLIIRLNWLNIYLPYYCLRYKVSVLHRAVPELPFIKVCKYVCTLHDLMHRLQTYRFQLTASSKNRTTFLQKIKSISYGMILKRSVLTADFVLVPSEFIKSEAIEVFGLSPGKIEVTHLGVFKLSYPERIQETKIDSKFKFIVVAGFYPHKGHSKVIALAKALIQKGFKHFSITFRGNPSDQNIVNKLKQEIKENKLTEFIFFDDFKKSHDLKKIYDSYNSLLLLSEYEGFGLPVLEAQAFGLPVICSNIEVFKEVLHDSAVFVDIEDIDVSSIKIINLIKDESLQKSLIEKGYENCERFSWNDTAIKTMSVYKGLK